MIHSKVVWIACVILAWAFSFFAVWALLNASLLSAALAVMAAAAWWVTVLEGGKDGRS